MKFNYDMVLSDVRILINHVEDCISDRDGSSREYIIKTVSDIMKKTPYEWYFCSGINTLDFSKLSYEALQNALEMLKHRLELAKEHIVFQLEAVFDDIRGKIIDEIINATAKMSIAVAWLSDDEIVEEIKRKAALGIDIRIILYDTSSNTNTIRSLRGIRNIILYAVPNFGSSGKNIMHNKFALFDDLTVLTGSYNWSHNASDNIENVLIISDERLAFSFAQKFGELEQRFQDYRK